MSRFAFNILRDGTSKSIELNKGPVPLAVDGFIWIDFDPKDESSLNWVIETFNILPEQKEIITGHSNRPRIETYDNFTFLSLRGVNFSESSSPEDMINLRVMVLEGVIFTMHSREMTSIAQIKADILKQKKYPTLSSFLINLIKQLNVRISDEINQLSEKIGQLEEISLSGNIEQFQENLSEVRRSLLGFQKHLIPQANVLQELWDTQAFWIKKGNKTQLRTQAEKISTQVEELEHLRQRATVLQEEIKFALSENMNRIMYRLTIVATLMLPLGLLAGLMGANVGGMPFADNPYGFIIEVVPGIRTTS